MIVREYRTEDSDELYSICLSSFDEMYDPSAFYYFYSQWPAGQLVACDFTGRPVGFLSSTRIAPGTARIMLLGVRPEYRSKGIGQQLLERFRMNAFMSGIMTLTLEVRPNNTGAIRFYKRNGFMETGIIPRLYQDGGDAIRMDGPVSMSN